MPNTPDRPGLRASERPLWNKLRRHRRVNLQAQLVVVDLGQDVPAFVVDISDGGMGVDTCVPLHAGELRPFDLGLPGEPNRVRGTAMVAWVGSGPRVGMQFINVPDGCRAALSSWLSAAGSHASQAPPILQTPSGTGECPTNDTDTPLQVDTAGALAQVAECAASMTAAEGAAIARGNAQEMRCCATWGNAPDIGARVHPHSGLSGACLRTGQPVRCDDAETDPRVDGAACRELNIRSILIVPLLNGASLVGLLQVLSSTPHVFNARHQQNLSDLAQSLLPLLSHSNTPQAASASPGSLQDHSETADQLTIAWDEYHPPRESDNEDNGVSAATALAANALRKLTATQAAQEELLDANGIPADLKSAHHTTLTPTDRTGARVISTAPAGMIVCDACGHPNPAWVIDCEQCDVPMPAALGLNGECAAAESSMPQQAAPITSAEVVGSQADNNRKALAHQPKGRAPIFGFVGVVIALALVCCAVIAGWYIFRRGTAIESIPPNHSVSANAVKEVQSPAVSSLGMTSSPSPHSTARETKVRPEITVEQVMVAVAPEEGSPKSTSKFVAGKLLKKVDPVYPPDAHAAGLGGTVVLTAEIGRIGSVTNVNLIRGPDALALAAINAVRQWVYEPFRLDDEPVAVRITIVIRFTPRK